MTSRLTPMAECLGRRLEQEIAESGTRLLVFGIGRPETASYGRLVAADSLALAAERNIVKAAQLKNRGEREPFLYRFAVPVGPDGNGKGGARVAFRETFAPIGSNLPDFDNDLCRDCRRIVHVRKGSPA
jgi:hypothetical protein